MLNWLSYSLKVVRPSMILLCTNREESPDTKNRLTSNGRWIHQMTVPQKRKLVYFGRWKMQRGDDQLAGLLLLS